MRRIETELSLRSHRRADVLVSRRRLINDFSALVTFNALGRAQVIFDGGAKVALASPPASYERNCRQGLRS
jgi:hypothetical protein